VKKQDLRLLKTKYQGFGPTLAHEKLMEKDKLQLSKQFLSNPHQITPGAPSIFQKIKVGMSPPRAAVTCLLWKKKGDILTLG
jgi:hypothetical protein